MAKLIILSNRILQQHQERATALPQTQTLLRSGSYADSGDVCLAWNGQRVADLQDREFQHFTQEGVHHLRCPLTEYQFQHYYCGYAHQCLWPALHHRPDLIQYSEQDFLAYQHVNTQFAQKIVEIAAPDDVIWVHDYHFLSVARHCRALGLQQRLGFFLHVPFAELPIWQSLAHAAHLIQDLSHYDLLGLQTEYDQATAMAVLQHFLNPRIRDAQHIHTQDRSICVKSYPIGVNLRHIQQHRKALSASSQQVFNVDRLARQKRILSVDRIDYSKGLIQRLDAIEQFLKHYPQYNKQCSFLQIASPCRLDIAAYQDLFHQFRQRMTQINTQFSQHRWLPIQYNFNTLAYQERIKLLAGADLCWVTSIADGMSLVAKEYIAAQDPNDPGVLVLSKYAGAAEQMTAALIVDPHDPETMAEALHTALSMSKAERQQRYHALFAVVQGFDFQDWRNAFLQDLKQQPIRKPRLLGSLKRI